MIKKRLLLGCLVALAHVASPAFAQAPSSGSDEPLAAQPEMQTPAVDALNRLGTYLRGLNSFRIEADSVTDGVVTTGQTIGFLHHTEMSVRKPDRFKIVITGSRAPKGMVYDGHSVVLFDDTHRYYSRLPAPPTIKQVVTDADEKYGVQIPLVDLFYWGQQEDDKTLTSALFIGLDKVDGKWCNHYAYQQPGLDWELWIESGSRPLPCRFVVTDTTQPSRPQHAVNYHWTLNPKFDAATFRFQPGRGAHEIPFREPDPSPDDGQQGDAQ